MTNPQQLAPTVGLSHDGLTILEGKLKGLEGYDVGRMTKSRRGKLYIDDAGWGPEAAQLSTGTRSPLVAYTFSSARSESLVLSRTSTPTSSRRLSVRDLPRLNQR